MTVTSRFPGGVTDNRTKHVSVFVPTDNYLPTSGAASNKNHKYIAHFLNVLGGGTINSL